MISRSGAARTSPAKNSDVSEPRAYEDGSKLLAGCQDYICLAELTTSDPVCLSVSCCVYRTKGCTLEGISWRLVFTKIPVTLYSYIII